VLRSIALPGLGMEMDVGWRVQVVGDVGVKVEGQNRVGNQISYCLSSILMTLTIQLLKTYYINSLS